ncbi:hypothetical protein HBH69_228020 [Parastagonospora nodorum]|nr:hypothetical protein HBH49_223240 [Parastagonospora nodorum]KAH4157024.1 hypothetical protein HBH43_201840 [Parastagonospora nodorum]KAH4802711.1 hypothetical protein HBH61_185330 [Parastagonospora nodorum]KAH4979102.1 hypothetical protein HBI76_201520 [Parastagonospora nodorum]KAH5137627.1 hypothetical protein HBH69_228020 [Parastagonospora nodorum]
MSSQIQTPPGKTYSVPHEASDLLLRGIIQNPLVKDLPENAEELYSYVKFEGNATPSIPINWRFSESISALKGFEAVMLNSLITRKYGVAPIDVTINTDHASLFFMSSLIAQVLQDGKPTPFSPLSPLESKLFPSQDLHRSLGNLYRQLATNIYKTKDNRYYHIHGSLNPDHCLTALGLPLDGEDTDTYEAIVERIQAAVSQHNAADLDELMNEQYRQAGTIAYTADEYFATEQGKNDVGLYEIHKDNDSTQPAGWWPENSSLPSSPKRPLAGLKVIDLTRIIAGPSLCRSLAELGASVMRIVSPQITDMTPVHQDLNWGKWNAFLHLKDEADKEKFRALIREADVVVDGYRPGVMEKLGFGRQAIFDLVKDRQHGIIHVRENCYGWHGPWTHRSGWQQISDACCGVSLEYGKAMGHGEAVTPVFPNADYCTGVCGSAAVLDALVKKSQHGGSYGVDVALNYYSQWLVKSCGTYPADIWHELFTRHGSPVFRHYHTMLYLLPAMFKILHEHDADLLFNPEFFEPRTSKNLDTTFVVPKPVLQFPNGDVQPGYNVGTRRNGTDQAYWPKDLKTEVIGMAA